MIYWLIDWFIHLLIYWLIYLFIDLLIYWLIDWLIHWLIDWLIDRLIHHSNNHRNFCQVQFLWIIKKNLFYWRKKWIILVHLFIIFCFNDYVFFYYSRIISKQFIEFLTGLMTCSIKNVFISACLMSEFRDAPSPGWTSNSPLRHAKVVSEMWTRLKKKHKKTKYVKYTR